LAANQYYQVHVEPGVVADIGRLTHLERLDLCRFDLTEMDALNSLANLEKLTHLKLSSCTLNKTSLRFLSKLENLEELRLYECDVKFKDVVTALPACPNLQRIHVDEYRSSDPLTTTGIQRDGVVKQVDVGKLVESSPQLKELYLATDELYEPTALEEFLKLESLNSLHIRIVTRPDDFEYPPLHSGQRDQCKRVRQMFEQQGLKRWISSSQSRNKSFTLPAYAIYVPKMSSDPAAGE